MVHESPIREETVIKNRGLIGLKFNKLTIVGDIFRIKKAYYVPCRCECGKIMEIDRNDLRRGRRKSCGCDFVPAMTKRVGSVFGKLTIIKAASFRKNCIAKCECGNEIEIKYANLLSGHSIDCGCVKRKLKEEAEKDIIRHNKNRINEIGYFICNKCGEYKDKSCFTLNSANKIRGYTERMCKTCKNEASRKRSIKNRRSGDINRLLLERWHGIKRRAYTAGYAIDFDWKYLSELWDKQNGLCALTGVKMTFAMFKGRTPTNLSVDRIDSDLKYTKDNIQLVCFAANMIKSDMSMDVFLDFCQKAINYNKRQSL